jgi:hypothetical protein
MTLKEHLHHSIDTLDREALMIIYQQIHLLQKIQKKNKFSQKEQGVPLDRILQMTGTSNSSWADTVHQP